MDPGLSDLLTCPRCGPLYGLILLPEERRDRRVVRGILGCANCRERYPVASGVADLRSGGDTEPVPEAAAGPLGERRAGLASMWAVPGEEPLRLGALLGVETARGTVLIAGPAAAHCAAVAELSGDIAVVGVSTDAPVEELEPVVSRVRAKTVLPFRTGSMAAVALTGHFAALAPEGVRVLRRGGRLLLEPATEGPIPSWKDDLEVLAKERSTLLATRR